MKFYPTTAVEAGWTCITCGQWVPTGMWHTHVVADTARLNREVENPCAAVACLSADMAIQERKVTP